MQPNKPPSTEEQKNLLVAFILSIVFLTGFYIFFPPANNVQNLQHQGQVNLTVEVAPETLSVAESSQVILDIEEALKGQRIAIDNDVLSGSLSTTGNRIDDMALKGYYETLDKEELVQLLHPSKTLQPYFIETGWIAGQQGVSVPGQNTVWRVANGNKYKLTPENPLILKWNSPEGLEYMREISVDEHYMMTVRDSVRNVSNAPATLYPYSLISKTISHSNYEEPLSTIMHQGGIAYMDQELSEIDYSDMEDDEPVEIDNPGKGWLGITDKYWFVSIISEDDQAKKAKYSHRKIDDDRTLYQADVLGERIDLSAGQSRQVTKRFFVGAKKLNLLNAYGEDLNIPHFDLAIDFGWFYIITKPLYLSLLWFGQLFSDWGAHAPFGLAIIAVTLLMRLLAFPLANKAFINMNKMKDLAPKMKEIKEKYPDNREKMQSELMSLYQKEKVSPASGCLPMLIQIPIFFALYKVLYVSIEMRHAPFYGWITDLSDKDPTNVFNAFGLLPFDTPGFLTIGALPLLYGLSMFLQQQLNPKPTDDIQKNVFLMLPIFMTYLFSRFPAGLVVYFVCSNLFGILQQYVIKKKMAKNTAKNKDSA